MALLRTAAAALVLTLTAAVAATGQPAPVGEDDVRAAFLYNFAKYVNWPPAAFDKSSGAFRLCVVADAAFVKRIDTLVTGETIEGHPVTPQSPATPEAARGCHILYLGGTDSARLDRMIAAV